MCIVHGAVCGDAADAAVGGGVAGVAGGGVGGVHPCM